MGRPVNLIGHKYGRLLVKGVSEKRKANRKTWVCECDCGKEVLVTTSHLRGGGVVSCGCYRNEIATARIVDTNTTHGKRHSPVYYIWRGMLSRCENPNAVGFESYGGRGISVCESWHSFECFYRDMGDPPPGLSIDRIDNDGNYEPGNCQWTTSLSQANNRRTTIYLEMNGERKSIAEWTRHFGLPRHALYQLLKNGVPVEDAVAKVRATQDRNLSKSQYTPSGDTEPGTRIAGLDEDES